MAELASRFGSDIGHVEVTFEGEQAAGADRIGPILLAIPQVEGVVPGASGVDPWIMAVRPAEAGRQVREAVLAAAARESLGLTAIRSTQPSLDEIYRAALQEAGLHGAHAEPALAGAPA